MNRFVAIFIIVLTVPSGIAFADVTSKAMREAAEYVVERFGAEATEELSKRSQ